MALYIAAALLAVGLTGLINSAPVGGFANASPVCSANTTYKLPAPLALGNAPAGLTVVDDGDVYYDVYGNNRDTIAAGLNACAPSFDGMKTDVKYLAYTSYNLGWSYGVAVNSNGTCRLSDVKVGLRVSQIYPRLMSTGASADITFKWSAFIAGTTEHEDGHLQIDKDLAAELLEGLRAIESDCSLIRADATAVTAHFSSLYGSENHAHDTDTDYGHGQGASW